MTETYANDSCMYTTNYHELKSFDFDSVFIKINKFITIWSLKWVSTKFRHFWTCLDKSRPNWTRLENSRTIRISPELFEKNCTILNTINQVWTILEKCQQVQTSLNKLRQVWTSSDKF